MQSCYPPTKSSHRRVVHDAPMKDRDIEWYVNDNNSGLYYEDDFVPHHNHIKQLESLSHQMDQSNANLLQIESWLIEAGYHALLTPPISDDDTKEETVPRPADDEQQISFIFLTGDVTVIPCPRDALRDAQAIISQLTWENTRLRQKLAHYENQ
eukprot:521533_1